MELVAGQGADRYYSHQARLAAGLTAVWFGIGCALLLTIMFFNWPKFKFEPLILLAGWLAVMRVVRRFRRSAIRWRSCREWHLTVRCGRGLMPYGCRGVLAGVM